MSRSITKLLLSSRTVSVGKGFMFTFPSQGENCCISYSSHRYVPRFIRTRAGIVWSLLQWKTGECRETEAGIYSAFTLTLTSIVKYCVSFFNHNFVDITLFCKKLSKNTTILTWSMRLHFYIWSCCF